MDGFLSDKDISTLAVKGGLRKRALGAKSPLRLSQAQFGLLRRVLGTDEGARKLIIAAMEMGTGKTLAALAALCVLRANKETDRRVKALFVVPKSTLYNAWRTQLRRFTVLSVDDVRVVTYPRMQRVFLSTRQRGDTGEWVKIKSHPLLDSKKDLVVFDESHVLRNPKTILSRAASLVSSSSDRVLCLTGTPVHNGPQDASGQLRAMNSLSAFENPSELGHRAALREEAVKDFSEKFVYSATLVDAGVTLLPKTCITTWVDHEFSEAMAWQYNDSLSSVKGASTEKQRNRLVEERVRHHMLILRQLCVEPALFHKFGQAHFDQKVLEMVARSPGPKLRKALKCVRKLVFEGHQKIVIVSEFVSLLDVFRHMAVEHLGEECLAFDGRLGAAARGKIIEQFLKTDKRILCLSLGAGAYGLNLTPGPTAMIIMDVWFNPAVHRQVEARIHRFGQTKPVVVHTLVTKGSVESAVFQTHDEKEKCAANIISGTVDNDIRTNEARRIAETCEPVMAFYCEEE